MRRHFTCTLCVASPFSCPFITVHHRSSPFSPFVSHHRSHARLAQRARSLTSSVGSLRSNNLELDSAVIAELTRARGVNLKELLLVHETGSSSAVAPPTSGGFVFGTTPTPAANGFFGTAPAPTSFGGGGFGGGATPAATPFGTGAPRVPRPSVAACEGRGSYVACNDVLTGALASRFALYSIRRCWWFRCNGGTTCVRFSRCGSYSFRCNAGTACFRFSRCGSYSCGFNARSLTCACARDSRRLLLPILIALARSKQWACGTETTRRRVEDSLP